MLFRSPLWVDKAIVVIKENIALKVKLAILDKQREVLKEELQITNQRVNLFEKVKIPECKENMHIIRIYLGDVDTAGVVRSKIAKRKSQEGQL